MTQFLPYPKIAESSDRWQLDEAAERKLRKGAWVATEKLHGANMCICADAEGVQVGKRRSLLGPGDRFFDYRRALGPMLARAQRLALALKRPVRIYGELVGGSYPHPDVPPVEGVEQVQSGVHYCPDLRFFAFDLAVTDEAGKPCFLAFAHALKHFEAHGIPVVPVLGRGKLADLLATPIEFESKLPALLGLPPLPQNFAEGMVVKPWDRDHRLSNSYERAVLKRKHPQFAEARFHESKAWHAEELADALDQAERIVLAMASDGQRLCSAITKIGRPVDAHDHGLITALTEELTSDVLACFIEEQGALRLSLSQEEMTLLEMVVEDTAGEAVRASYAEESTLDPARYYSELAYAFARGRLGPQVGDLLIAARTADLSMHKFKRKEGPPRVTKVLSLLDGLEPESLLDIGSGRGAFLWPLLARFPSMPVSAVDLLEHRVQDIEAVREGGVTRLHGHQGDVTSLEFDDDAFDLVTILEVLEHLADPDAAARQVLRVARRFVVASVPSHADNNPEHIRLFTEESLRQLFLKAGAERVQVSHVLDHMIAVVR